MGPHRRRSLVVPTRSDDLLATMVEPVGGPLGKRTAPGEVTPGFFTVERVLILMTAVAATLAVVLKGHCRTSGWVTPDQYSTVCFSVFPNSFTEDKLGALFPFLSVGSPFDESILAGWIAGITAWIVQWISPGENAQLAFFDVNAALIAVLWLITVVVAARTAGRRSWDAGMVACSPVLILTAYVSWDFWAVALVGGALFLFARNMILAAGVLLGAAAMAAPYPFFILLVLLLLGIRVGRITKILELLAAALVTWLLILLPVMLFNPQGFPAYLVTLMAAEPTESSLYGGYNLVAARLGWASMDVAVANVLMSLLISILIFGLAALAFYAHRPPRVGQLLFVAVGAFMLLNKGYEPWHAMWLLPLVVMAMPRWRPVLLWQAAIVTHFIALMLFRSKVLGNLENQHAIDTPYFLMAALISAFATCAMIGLVIRDIYVPKYDVVLRGNSVDPHAGVLATGLGQQAVLDGEKAGRQIQSHG